MTNLTSQERRKALKTVGAMGAGLLAASTLSNTASAEGMTHHYHSISSKTTDLSKALHHCVMNAEACINHCLDLFKSGDTSVADCAISAQETLAFCTAHARLASYDSKFLKDMCALSIKICSDCEKECRKHEKKHVECKACADSCAACIKACEAFLA